VRLEINKLWVGEVEKFRKVGKDHVLFCEGSSFTHHQFFIALLGQGGWLPMARIVPVN
jgi:hypothetical protein